MLDRVDTVKAVVITGASSGIGQACALYLDKQGWQVFAGVRKQVDSEALQRQASARLTPIYIDVTEPDSVAQAADVVAAAVKPGGLKGLINNAGVAIGGPVEFLPLTNFRQQFEINVLGQVAVIQTFLSLLRRGRGRIINMSSISGRVAMPFMGPYAASKFALEALTDALRLELQPWGIEVVSILPGAIATPIWEKSIARAEEIIETMPAEAQTLYGAQLIYLRQAVLNTGQQGISADEVAKTVFQALSTKRPKTRYLIGRESTTAAILVRFLPDRWRDWLIMRLRNK